MRLLYQNICILFMHKIIYYYDSKIFISFPLKVILVIPHIKKFLGLHVQQVFEQFCMV